MKKEEKEPTNAILNDYRIMDEYAKYSSILTSYNSISLVALIYSM